MSDPKAFYKKLKEQLRQTTKFPAPYLYKFIVPSGGNQVNEIKAIFDEKPIEFSTKDSKTGKYISVSIVVTLGSPDEIISYYRLAENINGIISL